MPYVSLPPVPVVTPADYVARAPLQPKPAQAAVAPTSSPPPQSTHGPAVILGGSLAKPAERKSQPQADPPKPAPPPPGQHINRVI